jgi:hypothetical protein
MRPRNGFSDSQPDGRREIIVVKPTAYGSHAK